MKHEYKLRVLDLFSGIGGFSLGLDRTGYFRTVAFCEIDTKARRVLAKHWPGVDQFDDVRILSAAGLELVGVEPIDVICGGFPCQDISTAGKGAGLEGERSGLWFEYLRLIDEIRPQFALIENVAALRNRGLDEVLRGLAEIGYDAEWHCIPASAVGAPHRRDRVWVVAYPQCKGLQGRQLIDGLPSRERSSFPQLGNGSTDRRVPLVPPARRVPRSDGIPLGLVRSGVKQMGNAVVPQIPQLLGEAIARRIGLDLV